jgi:hypothetical protein
MSKKTKVTTKDGKLYEVEEYHGTFYVRRNGSTTGKANSFDMALALIRSDSGSQVKEIC